MPDRSLYPYLLSLIKRGAAGCRLAGSKITGMRLAGLPGLTAAGRERHRRLRKSQLTLGGHLYQLSPIQVRRRTPK